MNAILVWKSIQKKRNKQTQTNAQGSENVRIYNDNN